MTNQIEFILKKTRQSAKQSTLITTVRASSPPSYEEYKRMFLDFFDDAEVPAHLKDVIIQASIEQILHDSNNTEIARRFANRVHQVMADNFDLCQEFVNEVNNAK